MATETIKARPTTYKGIKMRSRLEADYAAYLDNRGVTWEYEPACFASESGQWLPDFRLDCNGLLIEVKPAGLLDSRFDSPESVRTADEILARMAIAWETDPSFMLELVFWDYGSSSAPLIINAAGRSDPWYAYPDGDKAGSRWPGMGQSEPRPMWDVFNGSIPAEQLLLGAVMLDPTGDVRRAANRVITAADYYRPAHCILHATIDDLAVRGEPVDAVSVAAELTKHDLAKVGGAQYLHHLLSVPSGITEPAAIGHAAACVIASNAALRHALGST